LRWIEWAYEITFKRSEKRRKNGKKKRKRGFDEERKK